jgi:hypothetical protein
MSFVAFVNSPAFPLAALVVVAAVVGCVFYSGYRCGRAAGELAERSRVESRDGRIGLLEFKNKTLREENELLSDLLGDVEVGPAEPVELPPPVVTAPACPAGIPGCTCKPAGGPIS